MLELEVIKKIEDFVYKKPRSIQEIAEHINKNWRTADRYIDQINKNYGTLNVRIFRKGTRGALKIVYWSAVDKISYSVFQEQLENEIFAGKAKEDFSAFNIFQHIEKDKKKSLSSSDEIEDLRTYRDLLSKAQKQVLFFSGNLSFINLRNKEADMFEIVESLVKKGVIIRVICRVDIAGFGNINRLLSLNHKYGRELVFIHHREQPLRVGIIDDKLFSMKEIVKSTGKEKELLDQLYLFYRVYDKDWIDWLTRIFWKMFSSSIDAKKRLNEIESLYY